MKTKNDKLRHIFNVSSKDRLSEEDKTMLFDRIVRTARHRRWQKSLMYIGVATAACLVLLFRLFFDANPVGRDSLNIGEVAAMSQSLTKNRDRLQIITVNPAADRHSVEFVSTFGSTVAFVLPETDSSQENQNYKTVFVPYGKRQEFTLPDRSRVWLNAGSYLTYHVDMQGRPREVYLNGEGYFDVAHNGTSFLVRTKHSTVRVLGTTFNVSSYEEDKKMSVELITGKVELSSPNFKSIIMLPGQFVSYDQQLNRLSIDKNANGNEILWTKKQLVLDRLSTGELIRKLERIYNVSIHADEALQGSNTIYSGRVNLDVSVLVSLKSIYELQDYSITQIEKEVWIKKK